MEDVEKPPGLSKTLKRRLRRIRRAGLPAPVPEVKSDEPRLSKTAKRKLRLWKKLAENEGYIPFQSDKVVKKDARTVAGKGLQVNGKGKNVSQQVQAKPKSKKDTNTDSEIVNEALGGDINEETASEDDNGADLAADEACATSRDVENKLSESDRSGPNKRQSRYVLFVGNIPYTLTKEVLTSHFSQTDHPPKHVRMVMQEEKTSLNKGFAYVEFASEVGYLNALKLHHSFLGGRRINVEYSATTKGKNAKTKTFVKKKDLKLKALFSNSDKKIQS